MQYKLLGPTGLKVSELCLGTMTFGEEVGWGSSLEECRKLFNTYLNYGGNFIDTANFYTNGSSEKIIGELSKGIRERLVISTKYTLNTDPQNNSNAGGNHRKNLMLSVEQSLRRLQTDYIDLYWVHIWDRLTPVEEIMRGLDDLISAGKILYTGISDAPGWWIAKANTIAEWRSWNKFAAMQMEYNLLERGIERELLPFAKQDDLAILAWSPLAGGLLSGKYRSENDKTKSNRELMTDSRLNAHNLSIIATLVAIAQEVQVSPAAVALRWLQYQYHQLIPILGARKLEQLQDNLSVLNCELNADQQLRLNNASKINLGFPYDMLEDSKINLPGMNDAIHGAFKTDMLKEVERRSVRK